MITFVTMRKVKYSVIVPVFNRPDEVRELLESLLVQDFKDFEVVLVEDGSTKTCKQVYEEFSKQLTIHYFFKPNSGPGPSRNFGYAHANGDYLVVFDSDCILPPHYFLAVEKFMNENSIDAWGGGDKGHTSFSKKQRAMAYTMSSVLTTGGIRGGEKRIGWFQPRSFNMGISKQVFDRTGGFRFDRYAEDIEFSMRMKKAGFKVAYIPDAFVYHKRRTNFRQFYRQVFNFGRGRVLVGNAHQGSVKITHWFPTLFTLGLFLIPILWLWNSVLGIIIGFSYVFYLILIGIASFNTTSSFAVAVLSIPSAVVQLTGYGLGFLSEKLGLNK